MKENFRVWLIGGLFVSGLVVPSALAQTAPDAPVTAVQESATKAKKPAQKSEGQKAWSLNINKDTAALIGLIAQEAPLADLAQDLSQQLGVPVRLSPVMQNQRITAELADASVEMALRTLAPQVYLDEAINMQDAAARQLLGVYLSGVNEAKPDRHANLKEHAETVLFLGTIEEEGTATKSEENPLLVKVVNGLLTLRARRQPVAVVLYEIAQQYGVPFELRHEAEQLIDLDVQGQRLEDVLRQLAAPVQLMRRMNLSQNESEPLRIILLAPAAN